MTISVAETALDIEKKAIGCCARRKWLVCCLAFLVSLSIFFVFWCTNSYHEYVQSQMVLQNGTLTFAWWERPPINLVYKLHIFNYTNVDDYEAYRTNKLRVEDIGPYVYHEIKTRDNVRLHENGTVTYQEKRSFQWVGGEPENGIVVAPNVPLISAIAFARDMSFAVQLGLTTLLSTFQERPFVNETAGGYLWGYESRFFHMVKLLKLNEKILFENFGLMVTKIGVDPDRITMHTGSQGLDSLGVIENLNGMKSRNVWNDERCDRIEGTDGTMFPPYLMKDTNTPLYVYMKDICRKVPYRFSERITIHDIPALRYKMSTDIFDFSNTENECFCPKVGSSRVCPPSGTFSISACSVSGPLISSFPHFYAANTSLLEQIDGLNPQQKLHESYMDMHPILPIPIAGWTRIQLSIEVRKAVGVPFLGRLKEGTVLPIMWMDIGADELPEEMLKMVHLGYFTVNLVEAVFKWCSLVTMILSLCALIVCFLRKQGTEKSDSPPNKLLEMS